MAYRKFDVYKVPYGLSKHRRAQQWSVFSRNWYLFDCKWQDVFDAAGRIATYLQGKHKPIYDPEQDMGDHVVCINTKQLSLPDDEWRWRMYYHHTRYARGRTWAAAYELHLNDPTIVLYKACSKLCRANAVEDDMETINRSSMARLYMNKLHLYPDDKVPAEIMENILDQIQGVNPIFKSIEDYSPEERSKFPKITDYPDDYVIPKGKDS